MDSDGQTKIIDQEGNQIIVRANDARLQRNLTIHEYRTAFSRYKNVICEKQPDRRKELDSYLKFLLENYSRKAEQYYCTMGISRVEILLIICKHSRD